MSEPCRKAAGRAISKANEVCEKCKWYVVNSDE